MKKPKLKTLNEMGKWFDKDDGTTLEQMGKWFDKITNNKTGIVDSKSQILASGLISGDWSGTGKGSGKRFPMPEGYMSKSFLPKELIQLLLDNGWTDEDGNIYFEKDFQPEPVKDEDGNVHMIINDATPKEDVVMKYSMKAMELLYDENMSKEIESLKEVSEDLKKDTRSVRQKLKNASIFGKSG